MNIKWNRVDNWLAKLFAFIIVALGLFWMVYAVLDHYRSKSTDWEWTPFVVSGLFIMFGLTILSKSATTAAAAVILPFIDRIPKFGKSATSTVLVPPQPAQPAKVITTTVTPVPTPPDAEKGQLNQGESG